MRCDAAAAIRLGEVISPYGDVWCSLKPTPVVAEPVEQFPGFQMLRIGLHRDSRIKIILAKRVGQRLAVLEIVEV